MYDNIDMDNSGTFTPEQQANDYKRIISILQSIGSTLKVEEILERMLSETLALCNADQGSIILIQQERNEDPLTILRRGETQQQLIDHFLNTIICGWIIRNRSPLLTTDLSSVFGVEQIKDNYRLITSLIGIPLTVEDKIVGVLSVVSLNRTNLFGAREIHLLELLSLPFAQFIVNARLHETYYNEARRLRHEIGDKFSLHGMIGRSTKIQQIYSLLERIIGTDARVLLEGESGTGKELIARILHYEGPRKDKPFVAVDCGAIPQNLFESELFGYVKGAFTGAERDRKGIIEEAHGGTLFLDEITNMPVDIQSKFLRAVQEGEFRPIGANRIVTVDVRIIAAASVNIRTFIKEGKFREDLYYRLNVINIVLPPLRERREDIPVIAGHFLKNCTSRYGKNSTGIKPDTMGYLERYNWPGNIREMENIIERMVVLADSATQILTTDLLPEEIRYYDHLNEIDNDRDDVHRSTRSQHERRSILNALIDNNWNQSAAARELGMVESTLRYKMKKYGLSRS
jgi:transcriptional regulator with GAF, ATPase, and Fis domain